MAPNLEKIKQEIKEGNAQLLDVREQEEWNEGHLEDAILVPLSQLTQNIEPNNTIKRDIITYLHCKQGRRVFRALPILENMGFKTVIPMREGYEFLKEQGF